VSLRFSLTHSLFDAQVGTGAAHARTACDLSLVADPHAWDDDDTRPWPGNVGCVRVDPGQGGLSLALQPHDLEPRRAEVPPGRRARPAPRRK